MKKEMNYIRVLIMMMALMFGAVSEAWAQLANKDIEIDVKPSASAGTVAASVNAETREVTLTVTPASGYYIKASDIFVEKLVDPGKANAPKRRISEITDTIMGKMYTSDMSKEISSVEAGSEAKYIFTLPADYDGAYVTATFKSLTEGGTIITSSTTSVTYSSNGHYILVDDIDASVVANLYSETEPAFAGTFDGNGHTISGLTKPLFKEVTGGVVKNVMLKNVHINQDGNVGAITCEAKGYTRIYNCGILPSDNTFSNRVRHSSVASTDGYCGGLVGLLDGDSRVINCFSYANVNGGTDVAGIVGHNNYASTAAVSGGKYTNLKTAVVNCMFYGNITGGTNRYPVYGGELITNAAATGISSYNYYRSGSTFNTSNGEPTAYNCSFPAEERYLTQVEFHRSLLNSNRELCGWWVGSDVAPSTLTTTLVQAISKDASLMYKWVVDPSIAPYPILKPFGKYASVINSNTGTPWVNRATANPYEGKQLGTMTVIVNSGNSSVATRVLSIPITDMDTLHYDFGYRKIQLPYYNSVFGNPEADTWTEKYANNYTDQVVTGWKITAVSGGTKGSFVKHWETGYNFADRKCTDKDLYEVSGRVFAQGGNYYVPDGVTAITIEAYWGKAIYVRNNGGYYDRVNITKASTGSPFAPAGTRANNVNGATIQTTSIRGTLTNANIDAKKTVYDYALVLVGNVQESVGKNDVKHATQDTRGFTIMSVDLDFDEEPDYCLEWQLGDNMARQVIAPIRFDFLPVVELGIAGKLHNSTNFFSLGCYRSKGHFEVTETAFIHFGQFEFELGSRDEGPIILNGGIYDQYCRGRNGEETQNINYVILGGHVVMPSFTPGAHVNSAAKYQTRHCAVNALGGDFTSFYLTGGYNEAIVPYEDNPHCYIDGGRFGTIAAAYKEGIAGDVTWRINHALIDEFYGGGVMSATGTTYKIVKGSIDVVIDNSIVGKYCGGPKFGDMVSGKTVTTNATGTIFNQYFGAGNGGTNYVQYKNTDSTGDPVSDWSSTINTNYHPKKYRNTAQGYEADYDIEVINYSTGDGAGKVVNRSYYYSAQFATTNTGNVTSTLTDCTINTNFYGGGFLGGVKGNVTSTLNNCTVIGSVFGAGYSASAGTVSISNIDKVPPVPNTYTGMIKPQKDGTSTTYYWTNKKTFGTTTLSTSSPAIENPNGDGKNYFYTEIPLNNLGTVRDTVTLNINGTTTVGESIYGGGEESVVEGITFVTVNGGRIGVENTGTFGYRWGNVYGGGKGKITIKSDGDSELAVETIDDLKAGLVKGNTNVIINGTAETTQILHNVYGGGAVGSVGTFERDANGMPTECTANTGLATVTINGGKIGHDHEDTGMVNGSSRGWEGNPKGEGAFAFLNQLAWVNNTNVIIGSSTSGEEDKGPTIFGSVYGGGENGHNFENGVVTVNKGTVGYKNGTWDCGNIYGAGCGTDTFWRDDNSNGTVDEGESDHHNPMAGLVRGTTSITVNDGHVLRNVYGAGSMGSVGTYTYDENGLPTTCATGTGNTTININGGLIGEATTSEQNIDYGHVFGGPKGDLNETEFSASVRETLVNINAGADVAGSVFGGGEAGIVKESVVVNMNGGEVTQDVYGGGALANTNVSNTETTPPSPLATTTVNLKGGKVNRNVYGGALGQTEDADSGQEDIEAKVYGDVLVELNNGVADDAKGCVVLGSIFGCNNLNGTPMGDVMVHIYKTQNDAATRITNVPAGDETPAVENAKVKGRYDLAAVYGGGNQSAYVPADVDNNKTEVVIDGCDRTSIKQVYGGGNAACTPATNVTVNGTFEINELFGGGNGLDNIVINGVTKPNPGANVGYKNYSEYYYEDNTWKVRDKEDADTKEKRKNSAYEYGTGKASVNVFGGLVHRVFGGSNTKGNVRQTALTLLDEQGECEFCVDEAYGGGKSAEMDAEAKLLMACIPGLKAAYGGAEAADVRGNVTLNITNGTFDRVFGGNNESGTIGGAITINVEEVGCKPVKIGELYGGGNLAGYSVYGYNSDGTPKESGTKLYDDPQVNVMSFTSIGNIYGGGYGDGATMVGNPTVNINEVYGRYYNDEVSVVGENAKTPNNYPIPSHEKGKMGGIFNVFGGGNAAQVIGNTTVNIGTLKEVYVVKEVEAGTTLPDNCYTRSGEGTTASPFDYTEVTGTASADETYYEKMTVLGADIRGNVYGGGNNAEVTGNANVNIGRKVE